MAVLAELPTDEIAGAPASARRARRTKSCGTPENGLVMLRGRIGGDGAPFNLGEATVTRAAVRLESGEVGFAYVLGRDRQGAADSDLRCDDAVGGKCRRCSKPSSRRCERR